MIKNIVIIVINLLLCVFLFSMREKKVERFELLPSPSTFTNQFIQPSIDYIGKIYDTVPPFTQSIKPGGSVVWLNIGPFSKLEVMDETAESFIPTKSCNFVHGEIQVYINPNNMIKILKLHQSIYYDRIRNKLCATGNTIEEVGMILYYSMLLNNNPIETHIKSVQSDLTVSTEPVVSEPVVSEPVDTTDKYKDELVVKLKSNLSKDDIKNILSSLQELVIANYTKNMIMFPNYNCKL